MGILDCFFRRPHDGQPRIRNMKDAKAFMLKEVNDDRMATLLVEVFEKLGWFAYPVVERGGDGRPYSLECLGGKYDPRGAIVVQDEMAKLIQAYELAITDDECDRIDREIATLGWGHGIIRVNVMTTDEFDRQRALILSTWAKFKSIVRKRK